MNLGDYALLYAELGLAVFPLLPQSKKPFSNSRGVLEATTDLDVIQDWWSHVPNANIGIATRGLCVVDIDAPNHPWLNEKEFSLCPISITPRGGRHYIYRQHEQQIIKNSAGKLADKIDIRGDGGYIVAPPSSLGDASYKWATGHELTDDIDALPFIPDWLSDLIEESQQPISQKKTTENKIPDGQRNNTLLSLAGNMRRTGMGEKEILAALLQTNEDRCIPPLDQNEVGRIARSISRYEPDQTATAVAEHHYAQLQDANNPLKPTSVNDLIQNNTTLKPKLITGLLRRGETMNVVAAPKVGKSWLVLDMALSIATGKPWLGHYGCERGRVLIIDNELHPETSADRIRKVLNARGVDAAQLQDRLQIINLRGRLLDLEAISQLLSDYEPGYFSAIIIDAWYRAIPQGTDENDNGGVARLYNLIDRSAAALDCSFILIHHTSKGNQAGKSVTDVGAGAGSQSRAADVHVGLRAHREEGAIVLDAVVRSWKPVQPLCLRFDFPLWRVDSGLDPEDLDTGRPRKKVEVKEETFQWTTALFAKRFITDEPIDSDIIIEDAYSEDLSEKRVRRLLKCAVKEGLIYQWKKPGVKSIAFALQPPPAEPHDYKRGTDQRTKVQRRVLAMLRNNPELGASEIGQRCKVSKQYVNKIKRSLKVETTGGNSHE